MFTFTLIAPIRRHAAYAGGDDAIVDMFVCATRHADYLFSRRRYGCLPRLPFVATLYYYLFVYATPDRPR